jgi:hypothetical protein
MDIASLLEPVHGQPDVIVPSSSPSTSQQHHYVLISLPLPRSLQQAQRMSPTSSTTSSERPPVQNNSNSTTPEALSASSPPTGTSPRHRRSQIKAACIPCRKRKTKVCYCLVAFLYLCIHPHLCQLQRSPSSYIHATQCDGKRPSCKCCTSKVTICNYSVDPGMTQQQAIKIQLEAYKHVLMLLRTGDSQEREGLVGLLKKGDTLTEAMIGIGQSLEWAQEQGKWIEGWER